MFIQENEFFSKVKTILNGRTNLHVVIASRRLVDVYDESSFTKGGLRISILQSAQNASHIVRCASSENGKQEQPSRDHIYVLYASQSECERIRTVVQNIYAMEPASTVIIATCACDQHLKRKLFADIIEEKKAEYIVITPDCGGVDFMSRLISLIYGTDPRLERQASAIDSQAH